MEIEVIRSPRRLRTVSARLKKGSDTLQVNAPLVIPEHRLQKIISDFRKRFEKRLLEEEINRKDDLARRAARLNAKYFANRLKVRSIEYVTDQRSKFGCCNYQSADIRISHRVSAMPEWVRDYVVMHELAHLVEPNHGRAFWDIVSQYELAERSRGFLMATGFEEREE